MAPIISSELLLLLSIFVDNIPPQNFAWGFFAFLS